VNPISLAPTDHVVGRLASTAVFHRVAWIGVDLVLLTAAIYESPPALSKTLIQSWPPLALMMSSLSDPMGP
jgi:hypothetical protein